MTTLSTDQVDKPVERASANDLADPTGEASARALSALVDQSSSSPNVHLHLHAPFHTVANLSWVHDLIPGIEKIAVGYHCGNFVAIRGGDTTFFESMPLFARIGMHLLFYGKEESKLLSYGAVNEILRRESVKQGKIYDIPHSKASIPSFVETYSIKLDELLEPDIKKYSTFNEFFYRQLRPGARIIHDEENPSIISSSADCRLSVYNTVHDAKTFWIKGRQFNIQNLLNLPAQDPLLEEFHNPSLAIFRLAPADYHRFHSPIDCIVEDSVHVPGDYYTVNPQAVNESDLDVFTANVRTILYLRHKGTGQRVAFVAIGALLVGSIVWTGGKEKGTELKRGDELGYFAYGGSTVVVVFPNGLMEFDQDLVGNSEKPIETYLKVGESIGRLLV